MWRLLLSLFFIFSFTACGVKGKPLPPLAPRELGIGKPVPTAVDKEIKKDSEKDKETP